MARRIVTSGYDEAGSVLSPDSRWLAYVSNEQGGHEVFVRPFPDVNGGKWQVSSGGGSAPLWAHNGRELFYVSGVGGSSAREMVAVQVETRPTFAAGRQTPLFPHNGFNFIYDVTKDDQRFVMLSRLAPEGEAPKLILAQNFLEKLKGVVPN